jgi:hypothetical protein
MKTTETKFHVVLEGGRANEMGTIIGEISHGVVSFQFHTDGVCMPMAASNLAPCSPEGIRTGNGVLRLRVAIFKSDAGDVTHVNEPAWDAYTFVQEMFTNGEAATLYHRGAMVHRWPLATEADEYEAELKKWMDQAYRTA